MKHFLLLLNLLGYYTVETSVLSTTRKAANARVTAKTAIQQFLWHFLPGNQSLLNLVDNLDNLRRQGLSEKCLEAGDIVVILRPVDWQVEIDYVEEFSLKQVDLLELDTTHLTDVIVEHERIGIVLVS